MYYKNKVLLQLREVEDKIMRFYDIINLIISSTVLVQVHSIYNINNNITVTTIGSYSSA